MNHRAVGTVLCLLAVSHGCAFLTPKHSLKPQLEEIRALKSSLDAEWESATASLDDTVREMEAFSAREVDASKMDVELVRESILRGDESGETAKRAVEAVTEGESIDLEVVDVTDQTIALGQAIQTNLTQAIPELLTVFNDRLVDTGVEIGRLGVEAEAMRKVVDQNVLMSDAEKQEFYADHDTLEAEVLSMQGFLSTMLEDVSDLSARLTAAQAKFQTELEAAFRGGSGG